MLELDGLKEVALESGGMRREDISPQVLSLQNQQAGLSWRPQPQAALSTQSLMRDTGGAGEQAGKVAVGRSVVVEAE